MVENANKYRKPEHCFPKVEQYSLPDSLENNGTELLRKKDHQKFMNPVELEAEDVKGGLMKFITKQWSPYKGRYIYSKWSKTHQKYMVLDNDESGWAEHFLLHYCPKKHQSPSAHRNKKKAHLRQ